MPENFNATDDFNTSEENLNQDDKSSTEEDTPKFSAEEEILDDI